MSQGRGILLAAAALLVALPLGACGGASAAASHDPAVADTTSTARPVVRVGSSLVPGFPSQVVPVPPRTRITSSAVTPAGPVMQISLTATSSLPAADLLAFYRARLTAAGFTVTAGNVLPAGSTGLAFSRGGEQEVLVVAVVDAGTRRSFSVGGTVRA